VDTRRGHRSKVPPARGPIAALRCARPRGNLMSDAIDASALDALITRARRDVDDGLLPSCQLAVARHGELVAVETIGEADDSSRYVIFSCTKALIAGAVWLLLADGSPGVDHAGRAVIAR